MKKSGGADKKLMIKNFVDGRKSKININNNNIYVDIDLELF